MVLELLTTIAVAMVAVSVGLRLVVGGMTLRAGLAVIMLAPEVFAPLRQVAMQFHASTDGLAATDAVFAILDAPQRDSAFPAAQGRRMTTKNQPAPVHCRTVPSLSSSCAERSEDAGSRFPCEIRLDNVSVIAGDRTSVAPANLTANLQLSTPDRGRIIALVGPSGAGKSTTSLLLLGLLSPDSGAVQIVTDNIEAPNSGAHNDQAGKYQAGNIGSDRIAAGAGEAQSLTQYGLENWWQQLIWIPQRPALEGRDRHLSIGQRQRLALAAIAEAAPEKQLLILDEPTAHLDADLD